MVKIRFLKGDEVVVKSDDFGFLVEEFVRSVLRSKGPCWNSEFIDRTIREWWPKVDQYYQRHIMTNIEVAIALDEPPRYARTELVDKPMWQKIVTDLRPKRSAFSIDYHCNKCKQREVKLWRGWHGTTDGDDNALLCATCLAPDIKVDEQGKHQSPQYDVYTDQINGWLPAVPVDDTYWGYTSVPSQDLEWWYALPTYPKV